MPNSTHPERTTRYDFPNGYYIQRQALLDTTQEVWYMFGPWVHGERYAEFFCRGDELAKYFSAAMQPSADAGLREASALVVKHWWSFYGVSENFMEDGATNNAIADLRLFMMGNLSEIGDELKSALCTRTPVAQPIDEAVAREILEAVLPAELNKHIVDECREKIAAILARHRQSAPQPTQRDQFTAALEEKLGDALLVMDAINVKFGGEIANAGLSGRMNAEFNKSLALIVEARKRATTRSAQASNEVAS